MKPFVATIRSRLRGLDWIVLGSVLALSAIGLLTHYGARSVYGTSRFLIQACTTLFGIVCMLVISLFDYQDICDKLSVPLFLCGVGALVLTLLLGSAGDYGGKSWIPIGPLTIQPSEFVKPILIMTLAKHIEVLRPKINHPLSVLRLAVHAGTLFALVVLQEDLGTALVYLAISIAMIFSAGLSLWYFLIGGGICAVAFPYIWPRLGEYQQKRILVGFNPELDPTGKGLQPLMSRKAISAGGFFGQGLEGGSLFEKVPMANNDFVLSIIGEKFGFLGCMIVLLLFTVLIIRILVIAMRARKDCAAYIAVGIAALFFVQVTENMGMALAMLPVIGITLPFLSSGSSSVLSLYLTIGVLQSICTHAKKYHFEREAA
ncbi:MAG: FtsW/RodA/SpoVE family cell cycle protein [Eubacteriales bacterium]|nr:FtsW/RodA/SpoVE family cell cycle protein [Eubacteriales bacterium]